MNYYSPDEKLQIIKLFYGGNSAERTRDLFSVQFPDRPIPTVGTIRTTVKNFEKTFSLTNNKNKPDPTENEVGDLEIQVCAAIERNCTLSTRQIAFELNTNHATVCKILKKHKYRSFKVKTSQTLLPDDFFRRMEFCEIMMDKCNNDLNFLSRVLFTDESTFYLQHSHNSAVVRYWSRENLHLNIPTRTQYPQKLNVWIGMINNTIIGPIFINGNLNGARYLEMLRNQIVPAIEEQFNINQTWYQHDGCPAHCTRDVTNYLNTTFQDRWIGRNGPTRWPPRSPDLSPNDFYLWGFLKNSIYGHRNERAANLAELREKITNLCAQITPETFNKMRLSFYNRLGYCLVQEGGLFEHLK